MSQAGQSPQAALLSSFKESCRVGRKLLHYSDECVDVGGPHTEEATCCSAADD